MLETLREYEAVIDRDMVMEEAERFGILPVLYYAIYFMSRTMERTDLTPWEMMPDHGKIPKLLFSLLGQGRRGYYFPAYLTYFFVQNGPVNKYRFVKKTLFPAKYVIAHNLSILVSGVRYRHYTRRILDFCFSI